MAACLDRQGFRVLRSVITGGSRPRSAGSPTSRASTRRAGRPPEVLRTWVRQAEIDVGARRGTISEDARRIGEPGKGASELGRVNEILRRASAYVTQADLDRR